LSDGTIFALGDAATTDYAVNEYIVGLARKQNPTVCFLGTASGDDAGYTEKFTEGFSQHPCKTTHLSLFRPETADLRAFLLSTDIIYVGGGNTKSMIVLWREWGLDAILREAWESGVVLSGLSAGSICWFEQGVTDSVPGRMSPLPCLGLLPGSNCPHYDSQPMRRPSYQQMVQDGVLKAGYATDDLAGLLFRGHELVEIVSAKPNAMAYRVEIIEGNVVERPLQPTIHLDNSN